LSNLSGFPLGLNLKHFEVSFFFILIKLNRSVYFFVSSMPPMQIG
jgi:hypothetical protein